jgi:hypothetical protein
MLKFAKALAPENVTFTATFVKGDRSLGTIAIMLVLLQLVTTAVDEPNITELVPWVRPKFAPLIVTGVPAGPEVGARLLMLGVTVKRTPLLERPRAVTTTLPLVAPFGTNVAILVSVQLVTGSGAPLRVIALVPWDAPKLAPVIVTAVLTGPEAGERFVILGGTRTVKATPLLAAPPTVTTIFPVVAPAGTGTAMLVELQLVGVAVVPLKVTVLVPWDAPKFVPAIVTEVPTGPDVGLRELMLGGRVPLAAALNAASKTPPFSEMDNVAPTETAPAAA